MNSSCCRMKYSPTYKVVRMVGPRKGQNFFLRLTLRDLALWSWASRSYGEVASPSEAWREADMAARAAGVFISPWRASLIATLSRRTEARSSPIISTPGTSAEVSGLDQDHFVAEMPALLRRLRVSARVQHDCARDLLLRRCMYVLCIFRIKMS